MLHAIGGTAKIRVRRCGGEASTDSGDGPEWPNFDSLCLPKSPVPTPNMQRTREGGQKVVVHMHNLRMQKNPTSARLG